MEATASVAPAAEPQQEISDFGRIIGVLTSPGKTFADIARKPKWVTPILISTILGLAFAFTMNQRINWRTFIAQQIEKSPRAANMPADQKERVVDMQANGAKYFAYAIGGCGAVVFAVILGAVYMLVFNVSAGAGVKFKTAMSIVAHAFMTGLISAPMTMLVMMLRDYGDVDPNNMVATSLYTFLPDDAPRWLQSVGNSVELFWMWTMVLLAIGFSATNKKRISTAKALSFIGVVWVLWVFVKASMAALFS